MQQENVKRITPTDFWNLSTQKLFWMKFYDALYNVNGKFWILTSSRSVLYTLLLKRPYHYSYVRGFFTNWPNLEFLTWETVILRLLWLIGYWGIVIISLFCSFSSSSTHFVHPTAGHGSPYRDCHSKVSSDNRTNLRTWCHRISYKRYVIYLILSRFYNCQIWNRSTAHVTPVTLAKGCIYNFFWLIV